MNRVQWISAAAFLSVMAAPALASAQEGAASAPAALDAPEDWDMVRDPTKKMVAAYVSLDSGVNVVLRCSDGVYDAFVSGLPDVPNGETRVLRLSYGDHFRTETWNVATTRSTAMNAVPAPFARKLREGGKVSIVVPDGAGPGRNLRHDLHLPRSSTAMDETLTACGRPLVDPRDAALPELGEDGQFPRVTWARPPRPSFPLQPRYTGGFAVLSCLSLPDGRLDDCLIESEFPVDGGFGKQALRSMANARLKAPDGAPIPPRLIVFRTNFMMR